MDFHHTVAKVPVVGGILDSLLPGASSKQEDAQARQQAAFEQAIQAYQAQAPIAHAQHMQALNNSLQAYSPVSNVLEQMYGPGHGLNLHAPDFSAPPGGPPAAPPPPAMPGASAPWSDFTIGKGDINLPGGGMGAPMPNVGLGKGPIDQGPIMGSTIGK